MIKERIHLYQVHCKRHSAYSCWARIASDEHFATRDQAVAAYATSKVNVILHAHRSGSGPCRGCSERSVTKGYNTSMPWPNKVSQEDSAEEHIDYPKHTYCVSMDHIDSIKKMAAALNQVNTCHRVHHPHAEHEPCSVYCLYVFDKPRKLPYSVSNDALSQYWQGPNWERTFEAIVNSDLGISPNRLAEPIRSTGQLTTEAAELFVTENTKDINMATAKYNVQALITKAQERKATLEEAVKAHNQARVDAAKAAIAELEESDDWDGNYLAFRAAVDEAVAKAERDFLHDLPPTWIKNALSSNLGQSRPTGAIQRLDSLVEKLSLVNSEAVELTDEEFHHLGLV